MNAMPTMRRQDLGHLIAEHRQLIRLTNELEYQLYRIGETPTAEQVGECQQAAGSLINLLRANLFRHDQEVLPMLEALVDSKS